MIPFEHTWPYDIYRHDIYVHECPFCQVNHVLLPLKKEDLAKIRAGAKRRLVFPCCGNSVMIVDHDDDYLLADQPLRR